MGKGWGAVSNRVGAILILVAAGVITVLVVLGSPSQPQARPTDGLPAGKQATAVTEVDRQFPSGRGDAVIVVFERPDRPLTEADQAGIARVRAALGPVALDGAVAPPAASMDGKASVVAVPLAADGDQGARDATVDRVRALVRGSSLPAGLTAQVTGGPAFSRDISAAFDGADLTLLLATAAVVAVLLLITYRSPILWLVPLVVIGVADQVVAQVLPWVARLVGERTDAAVSGIVSVLVFGAGTDYALLLISRYREELRRTPDRRAAMTDALRRASPSILASGGTVILALLTLLAATLTSNRTLGLSAALGVAIALAFGLLVLPAALVCLPRGIFWPLVPRVGSVDPSEHGFWARIGHTVQRHPRRTLAGAVLILAALSAGLLNTTIGLSQTEQFRTKVESVTAQEALARHFPAGSSQPVTIISAAPAAKAVVTLASGVTGVANVSAPEPSDDQQLARITVDLVAGSGTAEADRTIRALRDQLAAIPGANALVGGSPAADLDQRDANIRDDTFIVPLILLVILVVLVGLLRSVLAPILLLLTVVVSFAASVGAATLVLKHVLDIPGLDPGVPLLSFLFLSALGVDYNIFLVSRAREETIELGATRAGMTRALAATGGVITSAGILLAAVFAVLGVLPVVVLTQIGVIVGLGVLIDTLLVRTLVVPAIAHLLGEQFWWPAKPASGHARTTT